jgi:mannose-6-phosphate isomerase class I
MSKITLPHNNEISFDPFSPLVPESVSEFPRGLYNPFPVFKLTSGSIYKGFESLARRITEHRVQRVTVISIEGYHGVDWEPLIGNLGSEVEKLKTEVVSYGIHSCLKSKNVIDGYVEPFLGGDDPLFGRRFPQGIDIFFDPLKLDALRTEISVLKDSDGNRIVIIWGPGASLIEMYDFLWYIDIPKDSIQHRARNGGLKAIGGTDKLPFGEFYKRSYFVDWPALNRKKLQLLPSVDVFIDGQKSERPVWMGGENFRNTVREVSENPFRVRPWFLPGPWGGKFIQGHMGLDPDQPNYAWSYELIVPENGVVIERNDIRLEFSFDTLMYLAHENILGIEAARLFRYEWPIRLDYLDTIDGGNLSTQCHPRPEYIKKNFGETFTQDETYYISKCKPGARVYLGLTERCDPDEFRKALDRSQTNGEEIEIDRFVYSVESKPHGLYLIPNGTVHCSGKGNLVLEISATPYIFTFKIYDYLRKDLNGTYRTLNVKRAWENIYFHRRPEYVHKNLLPEPRLIRNEDGWSEYVLSDSPHFFYNVHRVEFEKEFTYATGGKAFAANLVEGETVEVISPDGHTTVLNYLESMVIPAAAEKFTVVNRTRKPSKLVLVFVRPGLDRINKIEHEKNR